MSPEARKFVIDLRNEMNLRGYLYSFTVDVREVLLPTGAFEPVVQSNEASVTHLLNALKPHQQDVLDELVELGKLRKQFSNRYITTTQLFEAIS